MARICPNCDCTRWVTTKSGIVVCAGCDLSKKAVPPRTGRPHSPQLWLDDVRSPPDGLWLHVRTASECIESLAYSPVVVLSLDHDLGPPEAGTGYDVLLWIEEQTYNSGYYYPPRDIRIHSANPVGRERMEATIRSIRRAGK